MMQIVAISSQSNLFGLEGKFSVQQMSSFSFLHNDPQSSVNLSLRIGPMPAGNIQ